MQFKQLDTITLILILLLILSGFISYKTQQIDSNLDTIVENGITVNIENNIK